MATVYPGHSADASYDTNNVFAKIIRGDIPVESLFENECMMSFRDVAPAARAHVLAIPKGHYKDFQSFIRHAGADEIAAFWRGVAETADILGLPKDGFRLITNQGRFAGQEVPHFHVHILGGEPLGGLLGLPAKMKLK